MLAIDATVESIAYMFMSKGINARESLGTSGATASSRTKGYSLMYNVVYDKNDRETTRRRAATAF